MNPLASACLILLATTTVQQADTADKQRVEQNDKQRAMPRVSATGTVTQDNGSPRAVPKRASNQERSTAQAKQSSNPLASWLSKLDIGNAIDLLTLIVTGVFLAYTIKTWNEMVRSNDNAEKSNQENDRNTAESLRLTRESNEHTRRAVTLSERQFEAIAKVASPSFSIIEVQPSLRNLNGTLPEIVVVALKNSGYSPALNFEVWTHTMFRKGDVSQPPEFAERDMPSKGVVGAGNIIRAPTPMPVGMDAAGIAEINSGERSLCVWVRVSYDDIFGGHHTKIFASRYDSFGGGAWVMHRDTDANP
jgi:hypothetical protein